MTDIEITKDALIAAMKSIKSSSAPGPDELPTALYHRFAEELAIPLQLIWRRSLDTGLMPEGTILAIIAPIFKGGDKGDKANYRPVALTNHLTKIFERVLRLELVKHLEENGLMNKTQHGFRARHSTITMLLQYYDSILTMLEGKNEVDAIYLDLAKAFDKVDHDILLLKLYNLGIRGKILTWIKEFLKNRKQKVRVEGCFSEPIWVLSGVPQGSVLGPLLFIIMMIDINEAIDSAQIGSFADDTKLWQIFHMHEELQKDLEKLSQWINSNNLELNRKKFEHLHIGKNAGQPFLTLDGEEIQTKEHVRDLGIYMSNDLTFKHHIVNMVGKAITISSWILRTFRTRESYPMKILLKSLLVPILEYGSVLWSPNDQYLKNLIENVQRKFTSRFLEFNEMDEETGMLRCSTNYWDRLKKLKIYSLERRRERYTILFMHKVLTNWYPNPGFDFNDISFNDRLQSISVRPKDDPKAEPWVRRLRASSFFGKGPKLYELVLTKLGGIEALEDPENHDKFKRKLDELLATIPDQPTVEGLHRQALTNSILDQIRHQTPNTN